MKINLIRPLPFLSLLCFAAGSPMLQAQNTHHHYVAIDLGTLGGPSSSGCAVCRYLNNTGAAIFNADTAKSDPFASNPNNIFNDGNQNLGAYRQGVSIPLRPLQAGYNDTPQWMSDTGLVVGLSENGNLDPATGFPQVNATMWLFGFPTNLGSLGGNESTATGVNDIGQAVGGAANKTADPFANAFYSLSPNPNDPALSFVFGYLGFWWPVATQTHAFLWQFGAMKDLGTLGGPDSLAQGVNNLGQVTGFSYTNSQANPSTGVPTLHPFLWEFGAMKDLGSLGGTVAAATAINDGGQVIGWSNLAGDTQYHPFLWDRDGMTDLKTLGGSNGEAIHINDAGQVIGYADVANSQNHHAFVWQNHKMTDLGTVPGDVCSIALGINSRGQVVGDSNSATSPQGCYGPTGHGFLWENGGPMVDISTLYPAPADGLHLGGLCCINDLGEMLGTGQLPNGDNHAMLIVPCDQNHPGVLGCNYSVVRSLAHDAAQSTEATSNGVDAAAPLPLVGQSGPRIGRIR
jgi:probable HAF family extracellular repeat protein